MHRIAIITLVISLCCLAGSWAGSDEESRQLYATGLLAERAAKTNDAIAAYQRALELNRLLPDAHLHLALLLIATGKPQQGGQHLANVLYLKPESAEARTDIAEGIAKLGYTADAEQLLRAAIKLQPAYARAYQSLASVLLSLGRREEAINSIRAATLIEPYNADLFDQFGILLLQLGNRAEAEKQFREALRAKECHLNALFHLAIVMTEAGNLKEAERMYQKAIGCNAKFAEAYNNLGAVYAAGGQREEAVKMLEKARALFGEQKNTNQVDRLAGVLKRMRLQTGLPPEADLRLGETH